MAIRLKGPVRVCVIHHTHDDVHLHCRVKEVSHCILTLFKLDSLSQVEA